MTPDKQTIATPIANEGCILHAYQDTGKVWTIGYGTTLYPNGQHVKCGDVCTKDQALDYLINAMTSAGNQINALKLNLTQNQFDALVDFVYNSGIGHFESSQLFQLIKQNPNNPSIKATFQATGIRDRNGTILNGLVARRTKEAELYFTK